MKNKQTLSTVVAGIAGVILPFLFVQNSIVTFGSEVTQGVGILIDTVSTCVVYGLVSLLTNKAFGQPNTLGSIVLAVPGVLMSGFLTMSVLFFPNDGALAMPLQFIALSAGTFFGWFISAKHKPQTDTRS